MKLGADVMMEPGRYVVCIVSEKHHWRGRAGQIVGGDWKTIQEAEGALDRLTANTLRASGGGHTVPLGDCVVGIYDGLRHIWI